MGLKMVDSFLVPFKETVSIYVGFGCYLGNCHITWYLNEMEMYQY